MKKVLSFGLVFLLSLSMSLASDFESPPVGDINDSIVIVENGKVFDLVIVEDSVLNSEFPADLGIAVKETYVSVIDADLYKPSEKVLFSYNLESGIEGSDKVAYYDDHPADVNDEVNLNATYKEIVPNQLE